MRKQCNSLWYSEQVINCRGGGPSGIAIHDSGDIYVACSYDNCFSKLASEREILGSHGRGDDEFVNSYGLFIKGDVIDVCC